MIKANELIMAGEKQTLWIHPNYRCVYTHEIDGEIVYIGKGWPTRPFEFWNRNTYWTEAMDFEAGYRITILAWFATDAEAISYEEYLITTLNPKFNRKPIKKHSRTSQAAYIERLHEKGESYDL
jgi:hypothetical protein